MERNRLPHSALHGFEVDTAHARDYTCALQVGNHKCAPCLVPCVLYLSSRSVCIKVCALFINASVDFMFDRVDLYVKFASNLSHIVDAPAYSVQCSRRTQKKI